MSTVPNEEGNTGFSFRHQNKERLRDNLQVNYKSRIECKGLERLCQSLFVDYYVSIYSNILGDNYVPETVGIYTGNRNIRKNRNIRSIYPCGAANSVSHYLNDYTDKWQGFICDNWCDGVASAMRTYNVGKLTKERTYYELVIKLTSEGQAS